MADYDVWAASARKRHYGHHLVGLCADTRTRRLTALAADGRAANEYLRYGARPPQKRRSFYESDGQGRTSFSLIAPAFRPWQSARVFCLPRVIFRGTGWCRAVFFGIVPSLCSSGDLTCDKRCGRAGRTMVLSETRSRDRPNAYSGSAGGPMVRRVPRLDCGAGRTDAKAETPERSARTKCVLDNRSHRTPSVKLRANQTKCERSELH